MADVVEMVTGAQVDGGVYVEVGGRQIWHFRGGDPSGPPTVLVHGAFGAASTWGAQFRDLMDAGLDLYVPERSGHGHSPDQDGPFTYADMVIATIEYLEQVVGAPANLIGWSDGGVIALLVARQRPDLVHRIVTVSAFVNQSGHTASAALDEIRNPESSSVAHLRSAYSANSPDGPEHFDTIHAKTMTMLAEGPDFELAHFAPITAPALVVTGDCGIVAPEHALHLARTLPHGRLAVLPGTHILPLESPELFNPLAISFLAANPPDHWMP